jgi:leader peptidase (prepilin peptidase) / N-methyltransferase
MSTTRTVRAHHPARPNRPVRPNRPARPNRATFLGRLWQVPVAAALAAAAFVVVGARPELAAFLLLAVVTPELCRVDFAEHRLPNRFVLPAGALALACVAAAWLRTGVAPVVPLVAGAGALAFLFAMHAAGGLGMGDVKLGGVLALCLGALGVVAPIAGLLLGFVAGGIAGVAALLGPHTHRSRIPLGPFLLLGFWTATAASPALVLA